MPPEPTGQPQQITAALQEVSERAQVLVREEIELARVEITEKVTRIAKGAAIAAVAGSFVLVALLFLLHGVAWLLYYAVDAGGSHVFWGYFMLGGFLLLLGGVAGFVAARLIKRGTPPKPEMAIDEAQRIRATVQG